MQTMTDEAGSITGSTDQTRAQDHSPTPASVEASSTASLSNQDEGRISGSQKFQRQPIGTHISDELADETLLDDAGVTMASSPRQPLNRKGEELMEGLSNSFSSTSPLPLQTRRKREGEEEEIVVVGHYSTATTGAHSSIIPTSDPASSALHVPLHRKRISDLLPSEKEIQPPVESATIDNATHSRQLPIPSTDTNLQHSPMSYAKSHSPPPLQQQQQQHPGRRSITLRLVEEIPSPPQNSLSSPLLSTVGTPFRSLRRFTLSSRNLSSSPSTFASLGYGRARSGSDGGLSPLDEKTSSSLTNIAENEGNTTTTGNNWNANNNVNDGGRESTDVDRGTITVSWYEGTTSKEMQEHVFNCVLRKLNSSSAISNKDIKGGGKIKLEDVRLLDENVTPHGEVVLCPFLPDNSCFLLKFKTSITRPPAPPKVNRRQSYVSRAPDSPSAEPSPFPSHPNLASLDNTTFNGRNTMMMGSSMRNINGNNNGMHQQQQSAQQMQLLNTVAALLQQQQQQQHHPGSNKRVLPTGIPPIPLMEPVETVPKEFPTTPRLEAKHDGEGGGATPVASNGVNGSVSGGAAVKKVGSGGATPKMESISEDSTTDQLIEQQLRQLNNLFAQRRSVSGAGGTASSSDDGGVSAVNVADGVTMNGTIGSGATMNGATNGNEHPPAQQSMLVRAYHREEKRQVIFVIANYLVLFMGCIALSAEIQSRLPGWMQWVQENYDSVQNCSTDREALTECLSNGDFSGLVASFLLWATQSAAAKRIFLFGFDTPKKLWIVVYEALVSAVCWGTSYIFIRRGLNPNTRENFLHKYWKDAVYGSLAGFNAAFMKAVLKNLVPQDVALEALEGGRQLKIFRWLGSMVYDEIAES
mmetsp:Transcript_29338/g.61160  ORF Transcript_29338/g.61160 Transcript_29338/m.61160 type:complete len:867 (+) Transcript_29338:201-2801(+)